MQHDDICISFQYIFERYFIWKCALFYARILYIYTVWLVYFYAKICIEWRCFCALEWVKYCDKFAVKCEYFYLKCNWNVMYFYLFGVWFLMWICDNFICFYVVFYVLFWVLILCFFKCLDSARMCLFTMILYDADCIMWCC